MKTLSNLRYLLFAISLLGLFANFAQNEYGLAMLWISDLFIGIIFLVEAFVFLTRNFGISKVRAIYLFNEHFWAGVFFIAFYFRFMHWPGAGPMFVFGAFFLFLQYFSYLIRVIIKEPKKGVLLSLVIVLLVLGTIASVTGIQFKNMHWPGASILLRFSGISALFFIVLLLARRPYKYEGAQISFPDRLKKIPGKMVLVFCYFAFWGLYMQLVTLNVLPGFYTLSRPPALEKLFTDKDDARAGEYSENYQNFIYNRDKAAEK
jgi:hypothetical protein